MSIHRVIFTATMLGQRFQNVLHFENPDGALSNAAMRDELLTNFVARLRNLQNNALVWQSMSIQKVDGVPDEAEVFILSGHVGSLVGNPAPTVLCGLFSIRTGVAGRRGHGRFYMFGVHGDSVANSVVQSGALAAYVTEANFITNRFKGGGSGPITLGVCPRSNPGDFLSMTNLIPRPVFGIQRRRNIGVGG